MCPVKRIVRFKSSCIVTLAFFVFESESIFFLFLSFPPSIFPPFSNSFANSFSEILTKHLFKSSVYLRGSNNSIDSCKNARGMETSVKPGLTYSIDTCGDLRRRRMALVRVHATRREASRRAWVPLAFEHRRRGALPN